MRFRKAVLPAILMLLVIVGVISPLRGQNETIITLMAPPWMSDVFNQALFREFEAQHPGVKVVLINEDPSYYPPAAFALEEHLDGAEQLAAMADVTFIQSYNLSPESTRAGYFLDLTPLVEGDSDLDVNDFFPALWQSFQWDRGIWALPISGSVQIFIYDIDAFDEVGLSYPNENWTIEDLANAARRLTTYDSEGNVQASGFALFASQGLLYRAFLNQGFYNDNVIPNEPDFDNPQLAEMVEFWAEVQSDITPTEVRGFYSSDEIPLTIDQTWRLSGNMMGTERNWGGALLPGGVAGLSGWGFAISGGTQYPQEAYDLAKFLTRQPNVVNRFFGDVPARRSLIGAETDDFFVRQSFPPEAQALIDRAIENALPISELRFVEYLNMAASKIQNEGVDVQTALEEAEAEALAALDAADSRRGTAVVMVATPVPTPSFEAGQIVLNFGLNLFSSSIPNRSEWTELVRQFSEASPIVGNIELNTNSMGGPGGETQMDCFYSPYNNVQMMNLEDYLNLDPFMDADPQFDSRDFLGSTLSQVRRENRTWGYPIVLYPSIMWYNSEKFQEAGLVQPEGGWTIDAFNDALQNLPFVLGDDVPVFMPQFGGGNYLLMLMAAYGGMPVDYRTDPPTLNLTDPAAIDAMRQVLDLARDGYIAYQELAGMGGGGSFMSSMDQTPILEDVLMPYSFRIQMRNQANNEDPYRLTNYPRGSEYTPISYSIGSAYISANAQNPEACYEWIRTIAQRPELFLGLPARRSQIDNPNIAITQGEDIAQTYQAFADLMDSPNIVIFPNMFGGGGFSGIGVFIEQLWLYEVFDEYVLNNTDLETALDDTLFYIENFRDCIADIPEYDLAALNEMQMEEAQAYFRQFTDCAINVDPRMAERFNFPD